MLYLKVVNILYSKSNNFGTAQVPSLTILCLVPIISNAVKFSNQYQTVTDNRQIKQSTHRTDGTLNTGAATRELRDAECRDTDVTDCGVLLTARKQRHNNNRFS